MCLFPIECHTGCEGLRFCSSNFFIGCCNYYNNDICTRVCPPPKTVQPDNTCGCPSGFTGNNCDMTYCETEPCVNSGTCSNLATTFSCACPPGFTGERCDVIMDPCEDNPCMNSGTCMWHNINTTTFTCTCPMGFEGDRCQNIDECALSQNVCLNGGTCENTVGGVTCQCGRNWIGSSCEVCGIDNCLQCSGNDAVCTNCEEGYGINAEMTCCKLYNSRWDSYC